MKRLRITGLVSQANRIRQQIAEPMSVSQRERLAVHLRRTIKQVNSILDKHNMTADRLPAPSRRAFHFLKKVNLSSVKIIDPPPQYDNPAIKAPPDENGVPHSSQSERWGTDRFPDESISMRGLRSYFDDLLDDIADSLYIDRFNLEASHGLIRRTNKRLVRDMELGDYQPRHLKKPSRELFGWFRYFDDTENFTAYVDAVRHARKAFDKIQSAHTRWRTPWLIHFRPTAAMYRWQVIYKGTRIIMPTPMIAFDETMLRQAGLHMLGYKQHMPAIQQAMLDEGYQSVAADIDSLTGTPEQTRGHYFDLAEVFDRVNNEYFNNALDKPKLTWSKTLTGRVFGHYEFTSDTVMISRTLDTAETPPCVIEHVMHHELLHKKLGVTYRNHRQNAHTKLFRQHERTFKQYNEAVRWLNEITM